MYINNILYNNNNNNHLYISVMGAICWQGGVTNHCGHTYCWAHSFVKVITKFITLPLQTPDSVYLCFGHLIISVFGAKDNHSSLKLRNSSFFALNMNWKAQDEYHVTTTINQKEEREDQPSVYLEEIKDWEKPCLSPALSFENMVLCYLLLY